MRFTSVENPRIKQIVRLRTRSERDDTGTFFVEGEREIERAIAAGFEAREVFLPESRVEETARGAWLRRTREAGAELHDVSDHVYEKIAMREGKDGVLAVFAIPKSDFAALELPAAPLVLVGIGIEKPGNLGALARSAD